MVRGKEAGRGEGNSAVKRSASDECGYEGDDHYDPNGQQLDGKKDIYFLPSNAGQGLEQSVEQGFREYVPKADPIGLQ